MVSPLTSIGKTLRKKRESLGMPLEQIEFETKISLRKLALIEDDKFDQVENHFYNKLYIRKYSYLLGLNPQHLIAVYKRDFENIDKRRVIPKRKKELEKKDNLKKLKEIKERILTPKKIALITSVFLFVIIGVLVQNTVRNALKEPYLKIESPVELTSPYEGRIEYSENQIVLTGETEEGTVLELNQTPIRISPGFKFETDPIPLTEEETEIVISAENNIGKKSEINLTIIKKTRSIDEMVLIAKPTKSGVSMQIKADGIILFDGFTQLDDSIRIPAKEKLEITSSEPQAINITINNTPYTLDKNYEVFVNGKEEVIRGE